MADQLDIHGNSQPLTWDGEPLHSPETVAEGLFDPKAFEQVPGQLAINTGGCCCPDDCGCRKPWRPTYCGCKRHES